MNKADVIALTKATDKAKNLRKFMQRTQNARRQSFERIRIKRQQDLLEEQKNKIKMINEFLECGPNSNNESFMYETLKPMQGGAYILRDSNYSETSSVSGGSDSHRLRRISYAPERFSIALEQPKPKVAKPKSSFEPGTQFEVENILNMTLVNNEVCFEVKWQNYPPAQNTWECLNNVRDCDFLLDFINKELEGNEEIILEDMKQILIEKEKEIQTYHAQGKKAIIQELKSFDELQFQCYQAVYLLVKDKPTHYINFKKKFHHFVILNHFREVLMAQTEIHQKFATEIMEKEKKIFSVSIDNDVDFTRFETFDYVKEQILPKDEIIKLKSEHESLGCNCVDGCSQGSKCCPKRMKSQFAYRALNTRNKLRLFQTTMIYECDESCACKEDCLNRVTQQPRHIPFSVFKTDNGRGWGLKAMAPIPQGTFIMEYTGEVIGQEESILRGQKYDEIGLSYLFDLDYNDNSEATYTIDAFKCGNLSRLINHSCDPNCRIWPVTTCNQNPLIYKICYFSSRFIKKGEELTFDYRGGGDFEAEEGDIEEGDEETGNVGNNITRKYKTDDKCRCGSAKCRGSIFG